MAAMVDVFKVYQHPYDFLRLVVCIDEINKQIIKEERVPKEKCWSLEIKNCTPLLYHK